MKNFITLAAASALMLTGVSTAFAADDEPKFSIKPTGRMLLDGAVYMPDGDGFSDGVAMPDIRIGAKASYGKWAAKIDVGYSFNKLSMKDVYMQYNINDNMYLRAGYFVHQFGLQAATSSSMKPSMEAPITDTYFNATGRNIGVEYVYDKGSIFSSVSVFSDGEAMKKHANEFGKTSFGAMNRFVFRPWHETGKVAQLGLSLWYQGARHVAVENDEGKSEASEGYFEYSATFPTRVCSVDMLGANISNAHSVFKLSPEWLVAKDRLAFEGQYYYMNVNRKGMKHYQAQGVYGHLRGILIGKSYGYSHGDAGLATPGPKTLECVLGYNYTDATYADAGIYGGRSNDASITFNYYFNKYFLARLRYSYTNVSSSDAMYNRHVNTIQARLQVIF